MQTRKKKILISVFAALLTVGATVMTSNASIVCSQMNVKRVGITPATSPSSGNRVELQGGSCGLVVTPFYLHEDLGNAGLATVMTALSLEKTVTVRVPDNPTANDLITAVHVDE